MTNVGCSQWTEISSSRIEIQTLCESPLNPTAPHPRPPSEADFSGFCKINHLELVRLVSSMQIPLPAQNYLLVT